MFVKNSFEFDARVTKEARTLIDAGNHVTVIAYHVPGVTAQHEVRDDGIEVRRVSRVNFGVDTLNRLAARYAGTIEERHSRLTGEPVDAERARREGRLTPPSTAAPGAAPRVEVRASNPDGVPPTQLSRLWGRLTTPLLRTVTSLARFGFRAVKAVMGRPGPSCQDMGDQPPHDQGRHGRTRRHLPLSRPQHSLHRPRVQEENRSEAGLRQPRATDRAEPDGLLVEAVGPVERSAGGFPRPMP